MSFLNNKRISRIVIDIIDHKDQRYNTAGDWFFEGPFGDGELLSIKASRLPNDRLNTKSLCIALHELIEALLCNNAGITQTEVDRFDKAWELYMSGRDIDISEPGDDPRAPYHFQHSLATGIERLFVATLGIKWHLYERDIDSLFKEDEK